MLGNFLEIALRTADPAASFECYRRLGFASAPVLEVWPHAYGVVCSEDLALGLHGSAASALALVFARADVAALHRDLEGAGIAPGQAVLGHDDFNRIELTERSGVTVRVLEARTFSPPAEMPVESVLGRFWRLSLPAADPQQAAAFWETLGFTTGPIGDPWPATALGGGVPLAYHARGAFPEPVLLFRHAAPRRVAERLLARGLEPEDDPPRQPLVAAPHIAWRTPENLLALVLA